MIRITYALDQSDLAEIISADLSDELEAAQPLLIVLVSASINDRSARASGDSTRRQPARDYPAHSA